MATETQSTVTKVLPSNLNKFVIASNEGGGKQVDLKSRGFVKLEYSESILHDTPHCMVEFVDTGVTLGLDDKNVMEGLPLVGQEKATFKITDNNDVQLGDIDMYVNKITPMRS